MGFAEVILQFYLQHVRQHRLLSDSYLPIYLATLLLALIKKFFFNLLIVGFNRCTPRYIIR